MNKFYKAYLNIISQESNEQSQEIGQELTQPTEQNLDQVEDQNLDQNLDQAGEQKSDQQQTKLADQKQNKADLKFSADLASQFGNTVNTFTKVAAKIIKLRVVNKEDSDKIYDLMGKIKDLLDAANKSI